MRVTPLLIILFLACCLSLVSGARASPLYHLSLTLSSYGQGYAGSNILVWSSLRNSGSSWLNVSVGLTEDLEPLAIPLYNKVIAPGTNVGRGNEIATPSGYSPGNLTIIVKASYQYFDNITGKWTTPPDSPIVERTTLTVKDRPSISFDSTFFVQQVAPFGLASALAGIAPLILVRKRTQSTPRDSRKKPGQKGTFYQIVTSPWAPICLLFLALIEPAFSPSRQLSIILAETLVFSAFVLASIIALARGKFGTVILFSILFLGISATLLSTLLTKTYNLPNQYLPGSIKAGFPFQWYTQVIPALETPYCPPGSLCPLYNYIPNNPVSTFYLLADTLFYGILVVGILTAYKATIVVPRRLKAAT